MQRAVSDKCKLFLIVIRFDVSYTQITVKLLFKQTHVHKSKSFFLINEWKKRPIIEKFALILLPQSHFPNTLHFSRPIRSCPSHVCIRSIKSHSSHQQNAVSHIVFEYQRPMCNKNQK